MKESKRPRLVVDLTSDQKAALSRIFHHGELNPFFSMIVDDVISAIEKNGRKVIGAYVSRRITPGAISDLMDGSD